MRKCLLVIIASIILVEAKSQRITKKSLEVLESHYQSCLDSGEHMFQCSEDFYKQMDYSLNVVYKGLYTQLSATQKIQLKKSQLAWLRKRDTAFIDIAKEEKETGLSGVDYQMSVLNRKAEYVKDRVMDVLRKKY